VNHGGFDADDLDNERGRSVRGRFYRTVSDRYRTEVASPIGSSKVDGRYHTQAEDQVLYLSDSPTLSMAEATRILTTVPLPDTAWHTATFEVDLKRVLDLTDKAALARLALSPADLLQPAPVGLKLPQAIATAARGRGFDGVLAPSARPGMPGVNLVIFLEVAGASGGSVRRVR
jgi:RES domain-containing protein